jgi:hypothetical protein
MKYLVGFGRFWWDFIVGDSILLAVGAPLGLLAGYGLSKGDYSTVAEILFPVIVVLTLIASLRVKR